MGFFENSTRNTSITFQVSGFSPSGACPIQGYEKKVAQGKMAGLAAAEKSTGRYFFAMCTGETALPSSLINTSSSHSLVR